jgi:hypothetical protein
MLNCPNCGHYVPCFMSCNCQTPMQLADIIVAIALLERFSEQEAAERVCKRGNLDQVSEYYGPTIYGAGGWNRYYLYRHIRGGYRCRLSRGHMIGWPDEQRRFEADARSLGLECW